MAARTELLIVAAFEPELVPLRERLAADGRAHVACRSVGVGLAAAAAGTARALAELEPRRVLATGSAGLYPGAGAFEPGEVVVGSPLYLLDAACARGQAALPGPVAAEHHTDPTVTTALLAAGASRVVAVGTTLGITVDDELAGTLAGLDRAAVETLEAHGIAQACHDAQVPLMVLLGVTNQVGSRGRAQWLEHHRAAAESCAAVIARWLSAQA